MLLGFGYLAAWQMKEKKLGLQKVHEGFREIKEELQFSN